LEHADERSMVILVHQLNKTQNPAIKKKKKISKKERSTKNACMTVTKASLNLPSFPLLYGYTDKTRTTLTSSTLFFSQMSSFLFFSRITKHLGVLSSNT
jgi:hypothetical protein